MQAEGTACVELPPRKLLVICLVELDCEFCTAVFETIACSSVALPLSLGYPMVSHPRSFRAPIVVVVDLIITVLSSEREKFANSLPSTEIRALIRQEAGATPAISPSSFVPCLETLGTFRGEERNRARLCRRDFRRFDPDAKRKR